jgi:hypothetical protein
MDEIGEQGGRIQEMFFFFSRAQFCRCSSLSSFVPFVKKFLTTDMDHNEGGITLNIL